MLQRRSWYTLLSVMISCILVSVTLGALNAIYTQRQVIASEKRDAALRIEQDRRWCALLTQLDQNLPAQSTIRPMIHELRREFGCGG